MISFYPGLADGIKFRTADPIDLKSVKLEKKPGKRMMPASSSTVKGGFGTGKGIPAKKTDTEARLNESLLL